MASTTESLGRLIAEEVLLQSERQLLRNRDQPGQQTRDPPASAAPVSAPISHNDKAVASVLLRLLDEQLDALDNRIETSGDPAAARAGEGKARPAQNHIVAQYAEEDAIFRPDPPTLATAPLPNLADQRILLAASSPEVRMAMQSAFLSATVRAQSENRANESPGARRGQIGNALDSSSLMRVGAGIFAVTALAIFVMASFAR
jgi:hypothetical protein